MKLYFSPGACSMSPHIVLLEAGLPFTLERVELASKKTAGGADYTAVNPKGYVPALETDGGVLLTEGPAIVQYLADLVPEKQLAPPAGSIERYQLMSLLNFIGTELHKSYSPLFKPQAGAEVKAFAKANLVTRYAQVESLLDGSQFSVADAYLFTITNWAGRVELDLTPWPRLRAFQARVAARPSVQQALKAEGLLP